MSLSVNDWRGSSIVFGRRRRSGGTDAAPCYGMDVMFRDKQRRESVKHTRCGPMMPGRSDVVGCQPDPKFQLCSSRQRRTLLALSSPS